MKKKQIIRLILACCCLLVSLVLACVNSVLSGILTSQQAAERWQNDMPSAQISVFLRPGTDFSVSSVESLHESIEASLTSASLQSSSENTRLWYDAYSTQAGQTEITGTRKSASEALVTVVGGDFFMIHASELISGGYFSEKDLMHDRVVIDTTLAWQLFGSSDVAGMEIIIKGKPCLIAGVIRPETDYASETAYGTMPRIYLSYDFYQKNWNDSGTDTISCYEIILPNPVKNFARNTVKETLDIDESIILQNTDRYSLSGQWNTLRNFRKLVVCENVAYPYWENAARIISFDTAVLFLLEILFLIYPVIYLICLICKSYSLAEKTIWRKRMEWKSRYRSQIKQI